VFFFFFLSKRRNTIEFIYKNIFILKNITKAAIQNCHVQLSMFIQRVENQKRQITLLPHLSFAE